MLSGARVRVLTFMYEININLCLRKFVLNNEFHNSFRVALSRIDGVMMDLDELCVPTHESSRTGNRKTQSWKSGLRCESDMSYDDDDVCGRCSMFLPLPFFCFVAVCQRPLVRQLWDVVLLAVFLVHCPRLCVRFFHPVSYFSIASLKDLFFLVRNVSEMRFCFCSAVSN